MNSLNDLLRPHVGKIMADAANGNETAKNIIALHRMYVTCSSDPGAPALCRAAFDEWLGRQ